MGVCNSSTDDPEVAKSKIISKSLESKYFAEKAIQKLLLLGSGESGKSTLFKQMISLYGSGFSKNELLGFSDTIAHNVISGMKKLIFNSRILRTEKSDPNYEIDQKLYESIEYVEQYESELLLDRNLASHIANLWADSGIRFTFKNKAFFQLSDGVDYFFDRAMEISNVNYIPSFSDILRCRAQTTGIIETDFKIEDVAYRMFDVGGQRNERSKWIHAFDGVTAVIFVASISEYDQKLFEDESKNRMEEALELFEATANIRWFRDTQIILFLNKRDLFEQKIKQVPLTVCFNNYNGPQTYKDGVEFIQKQYEKRYPAKKPKYIHITCATDSDNVVFVFNAVNDICLKASLELGGLM